MHFHDDNYLIQFTAIFHLMNITKDRQTSKIHVSILLKVVKGTLYAMEHFPNAIQLQKCALFILSNDRILLVCISNI